MEIYLFIGLVYAFFNRDSDLGVYGFVRNVFLWPLDIGRNIITGWNRAKGDSTPIAIATSNIQACIGSMDEFHNILENAVYDVTNVELNELEDAIHTSLAVYEIQAALAAARKFRLNKEHHRNFTALVLTNNFTLPESEALGMVDAVLTSPKATMEWTKEAIDGETGYKLLTLGTNELEKHIKGTINRLQAMQNCSIP